MTKVDLSPAARAAVALSCHYAHVTCYGLTRPGGHLPVIVVHSEDATDHTVSDILDPVLEGLVPAASVKVHQDGSRVYVEMPMVPD